MTTKKDLKTPRSWSEAADYVRDLVRNAKLQRFDLLPCDERLLTEQEQNLQDLPVDEINEYLLRRHHNLLH